MQVVSHFCPPEDYLLQVVDLAVLLCQILYKISGIEVSAGFFDDLLRCIQASVLMDSLTQPCRHTGKVSAGNILPDVELLLHVVQHLRPICASKRIGREVANQAI